MLFATPDGSTRIPVKLTKDSIHIANFKVLDKHGNAGKGEVVFIHDQFKKFDTYLDVQTDLLFALNTTYRQNNLYYGKAYISGDIQIFSGAGVSRINMDVKAEEKTVFNLPLTDETDLEENQFVVFVKSDEMEDERNGEKEEKEDGVNVELDMVLRSSPKALIRLVFDESSGDVIEARGLADLSLRYDPLNDLQIFGNYIIESGSYMFTLQNVVNKRFVIEEGGSIRWNGDPYQGEMDIITSYKTRARLVDILPEIYQDVNYKRKTAVHLRLRMTQSIESPVIGFEVFLPDSPENIRQQLNAQLSDASCLNQQVFSLLILTSFTPCEIRDGSTASTDVGKSTAYEAMSNQLSGWLSNISEDFDIGVSYTPEIEGESYTPEQVEVAISTQLYNDRLIIDANASSGN